MRQVRFASRFISALSVAALALGCAAAAEGQFKLRVQTPDPARFYLDDSQGKAWAPGGAIVYQRRSEKHFVVRNGFEIQLPAGTYTLIAERGPEFRPFQVMIDARPGEERTIPVAASRWIDLNRLGWYSGDLHNHRSVEDMPLLLLSKISIWPRLWPTGSGRTARIPVRPKQPMPSATWIGRTSTASSTRR